MEILVMLVVVVVQEMLIQQDKELQEILVVHQVCLE
jgi:hypothetical protein